ncbi:MAG: nucleoside deaminase [Chitinophagales bacterium]|nr:nucleoside deaminase [Chitinophagales bacterium]
MESFNSDEFYMRMALKEAMNAYDLGEVPVGAVIVSESVVIAKGHNYVEKLNDVTAHAEIIAITSASENLGSKYLTDCTMYVTLEPCLMCATALKWAQLSRLVFGAADLKEGFSNYTFAALHKKTKIQSGILGEECGKLLTQFFKEQREKKKLSS